MNRTAPSRPDDDLGPLYLAISWTTVSLATILVALRLYVRCNMRASGWDDYLIYLALVCLPVGKLDALRKDFGSPLNCS